MAQPIMIAMRILRYSDLSAFGQFLFEIADGIVRHS